MVFILGNFVICMWGEFGLVEVRQCVLIGEVFFVYIDEVDYLVWYVVYGVQGAVGNGVGLLMGDVVWDFEVFLEQGLQCIE